VEAQFEFLYLLGGVIPNARVFASGRRDLAFSISTLERESVTATFNKRILRM
jgi:hypothetical protein